MTIKKKVKSIYRFHKLVFDSGDSGDGGDSGDSGDSSLECFNRAIQNYQIHLALK
jgi:hypothetical protein